MIYLIITSNGDPEFKVHIPKPEPRMTVLEEQENKDRGTTNKENGDIYTTLCSGVYSVGAGFNHGELGLR